MDKKSLILIVDDTPENLRVLGDMLELQGYEVLVSTNGLDALENARSKPEPDLILLDIMMPDIDGYEVCRRLKANTETSTIPVIFISALGLSDQKIHAFRDGAVDYITKPFQVEEVLARVNTHLQLKHYQDNLQLMVEEQTRKYLLARDATIASMAILAEYRDPETGGHIQRTKHYVRILAQELNHFLDEPLSAENMELLFQSVPLHDIGKVGISDAILNKPGPLCPSEFDEMKKHCILGSDAIKQTESILGASSFLNYAHELTEFHHEKWDGSGYPHGLKGKEIPLSARIMMLADIYDALISIRPYKESYTFEKAFQIITEGDGRTLPEQFDPDVLKAFRRTHLEFERIARSLLDCNGDPIIPR